MKRLLKISKALFVFVLIGMLLLPFVDKGKIHAETVGVGATNNGNGTFTVSVSSSLTGRVNVTTSNGGNVLYWCEGGVCNVESGSATISGNGTISVTATPKNPMDDGEGTPVNSSGSSTSVTVTSSSNGTTGGDGGGTQGNSGGNSGETNGGASNPETPKTDAEEDAAKPDKDATSILSALTIDKGTLSPEFAPTTTAYTVNLPAGTTSLKVSATAKQEKASVEGIGDIALQVGENTLTIRCIAEDGSVSEYTIKATVGEEPITYVKYGKKKLGLLNESAAVSNLFNETKIKVDGHEVIAWVNEKLKMTLLYMQDETTNEKNLYVYDTKKKEVTSIYKPFAYKGMNLVMIDVPQELQKREGMKFTSIKLGEYTLPGWEFKDKNLKNYALLYVMDDKGNTLYYQYERSEDSLQLFSQAAAISQDAYESYVKKMEKQEMIYLIAILALSVITLLLFVAVIVLLIKRKKQGKFKKVPIENATLSAEAKSLLLKDE